MPYRFTDYTDARILRKKAEELYRKNAVNSPSPEVELDEKKLFHELQIHHLELELQNEALQIEHVKAEVALKKYTILFDMSSMGYFLLDPDGTISELNFTAADLLHERRFALKGTNFKLFVSDESKSVFNIFFKKVFVNHHQESCRIMITSNDNAPIEVYIEGIIVDNDQRCLLSVINLSKFRLQIESD